MKRIRKNDGYRVHIESSWCIENPRCREIILQREAAENYAYEASENYEILPD